MSSPTIAFDAFGGDQCPGVEIEAAVLASRDDLRILLVGDEAQLAPRLQEVMSRLGGRSDAVEIFHAPDVIRMDDSPARALRSKPNASMSVCFDLVKKGQADAVVSAGNSGAMLAGSLFKFGRIRGVDRPAIATVFPKLDGECCLLDVGANVECKPINLVQSAVMGAEYFQVELGGRKPKVGLLSNGSEETKGTELTREAHQQLRNLDSAQFEYIGYVEGSDLFGGEADVVVTDGFTGNVSLKVVEGTVLAAKQLLKREVQKNTLAKLGALLMRGAFRNIRDRLDADQYGGAPLLGVRGVTIICHGGSSPVALVNGIRLAARFVRQGVGPHLEEAIARIPTMNLNGSTEENKKDEAAYVVQSGSAG